MLHTDIVLRRSKINEKGLFARKSIPKGTVVWVLTKKDKVWTSQEYKRLDSNYRKKIHKYVYFEDNGDAILIDRISRHRNHSCNPNTSHCSRIGMDIALRDIKKGEEITYEYAFLLLSGEKLVCNCESKNCRKVIKRLSENSRVIKRLYRLANQAAKDINKVKQPLLKNPLIAQR